VKANAYGHGAVARRRSGLDGRVGTRRGASTRPRSCAGGHDAPIPSVGYTHAAEAERIVDLRLTPTVCNLQAALALSRFASQRGVTQRIHIELESGLNGMVCR
jgi:alanine racemase